MSEVELTDFLNQQEKPDDYDALKEVLNSLSRKNKKYRLSQLDSSDKDYSVKLMALDNTLFSNKKNKIRNYLADYMDICVSETEVKARSLIDILADIVKRDSNERQPIIYGGSPEVKG